MYTMSKYTAERRSGSLSDHVKYLDTLPFLQQKSEDWLELRSNLITASSAYNVIPKTQKVVEIYNNLVPESVKEKEDLDSNSGFFQSEYLYFKRKLGLEKFTGSAATFFGEKYEDVGQYVYQQTTNKDVHNYGILTHSEYPWLGASPDGISTDGVALEIKSLYTRQMIDDNIPLKYYIQVQIALEVLDLETCDYIETKIEEFTSFIPFWKRVNPGDVYGIVLENEDATEREYLFNCSVAQVKEFVDKPAYTPTFFKVLKSNIKSIPRSREFFKEILPYLSDAKDKLKKLRNGSIKLENMSGYVNFL